MIPSCAVPVRFATLIEYWFGELGADAEERIEEHLLGCAHCSSELEALSELGQGMRATLRKGAIHAVISVPFLATMKEHGMRLREYLVSPGGSVHCTITDDDDAVIGRLRAPLVGLGQVDVVIMDEAGALLVRFDYVPSTLPRQKCCFARLRLPLSRCRRIQKGSACSRSGPRASA